MDLKDLKFDKRNYRRHNDRNKELIKKSIEEVGFGRSIVIDAENEIVCGNGVVSQADKDTKIKVIETDGSELVVIKRTDLKTSDAKRKQLAVMDNSASDTSDFDMELLQEDFSVDELNDWGIDVDFAIEEETEVVEDEVPEEVETRCKLGDIWQLGEHRLMCGDSTSVTDVEKLMNGIKADMVFTDPPYGMFLDAEGFDKMPTAKGTTHKGYSNIIGDAEDFKDDFINNIFACFGYCKEIFLWGADYYTELLPNKNNGSWIVWDKRQEGGLDKLFGSCFELCWSKQKHKREIARILWAGYFGMSGTDTKERVHPTQKPVELVAWFFNKYGKENQSIVDLFGGSGSTLIACEQLNRKCFMMELDEKYCDVIIQRWENLTGQKAVQCS